MALRSHTFSPRVTFTAPHLQHSLPSDEAKGVFPVSGVSYKTALLERAVGLVFRVQGSADLAVRITKEGKDSIVKVRHQVLMAG